MLVKDDDSIKIKGKSQNVTPTMTYLKEFAVRMRKDPLKHRLSSTITEMAAISMLEEGSEAIIAELSNQKLQDAFKIGCTFGITGFTKLK